jgi:HK97 family phage major capsid protein
MSERLDRLAADYQLAGELLSICAIEGREPTEQELRNLARPTPFSTTTTPGLVRVHREAATYAPPDARGGERVSFFRDLLHAQLDGDPDCRARIERHSLETRAVGTTGTAPGVAPPTWLFTEFAMLQHANRPWADTLRRIEITNANPVNIGKQATPGAVVGAQANQGDAPADGSFNANVLTTNPATYTGKVDVSRQLLDGSNPAIDSLVYSDCMGAYNEAIEQAVVNAIEAATGFAAVITYPGTAPVYTILPDAFVDAAASVRKHRRSSATAVLCGIGSWAFLAKQKDSNNRPLIATGDYGVNVLGVGQAITYDHVAGEVNGLYVIPSWAALDNHMYVAKADDLILLESSTFNFRYEEVLGPSSIRLGVWGYAAPMITRYPTALAKIDAGTTIPAPAAAEAEATPAETHQRGK